MAICLSIPHYFIKYPPEYRKCCPICHHRVRFAYPGRKRTIKDLHGEFDETRYFYRCSNSDCFNYQYPFNPSPKCTLPEKRYSNSVWKWIGREAKIYNSNAGQIHERISKDFDLNISENTIRNVIDELDSYLEGKIDEKTKERMNLQGKIVLSLDGQKPEDGEKALWLFVDIISDRVLDIQILDSADYLTLHKCIEKIISEYNVELVGLLSDKQGSIVKMRSEFYPEIPHQYCQFHFLQNIWNFIEVKDSTLQKQLSKMINHLPITTRSKEATVEIPDIGSVQFRKFFAPVEKDLRKLIKNRGKKFEILRGIRSFTRIREYYDEINQIIENKPPEHRITKILRSTANKMSESLNQETVHFQECEALYANFKSIQADLASEIGDATELDRNLEKTFEMIWDSIKSDRRSIEGIKATLPNKNMTAIAIKEQWYRLFRSYRKGLFRYFEFPVRERTNSKMEQKIGQEKMKFIQRSGKANVSRQIRVRGIFELKMQYVTETEILENIEALEGSYSREEVFEGLKKLQERQNSEQERWQSVMGGADMIKNLYKNSDKKT